MVDRDRAADVYQLTHEGAAEQKQGAPEQSEMEVAEPQPSMTWLLLRELIETIVLALIIFVLIRQVVQNYRIESTSMLPNFVEGQFILVNKLAFNFGAPERGDVIVFHNPLEPQEDYIKRVIGLPGDTIAIQNQQVLINGEPLEETFPHEQIAAYAPQFGPVVVDPDHLFVMGDNRNNSKDSREFGALDEDLIVGKAWLRIWPLHHFGLVPHYDLDPAGVAALGP